MLPEWKSESSAEAEGTGLDDRTHGVDPTVSVRNSLLGTVVSIHQGLTSTGARIRVGVNLTLRVRRPQADNERMHSLKVGAPVVARIPAQAILLGVSARWLGSDRWTRWSGRVVLVGPSAEGSPITVKMHGEGGTLKCAGPVRGANGPPQAWDPVTIAIDPMQVDLIPGHPGIHDADRVDGLACASHLTGGRVWMKGCVRTVRLVPVGTFLGLSIGSAEVSALISSDREGGSVWKPGEEVEIHVDGGEAWVRRVARSAYPVRCSLSYPSV